MGYDQCACQGREKGWEYCTDWGFLLLDESIPDWGDDGEDDYGEGWAVNGAEGEQSLLHCSALFGVACTVWIEADGVFHSTIRISWTLSRKENTTRHLCSPLKVSHP